MKISFETKVWEKDWEFILKTSRIQKILDKCNYNFDRRILLINNVDNYGMVANYADRLVKIGVLTEYIDVSEHADKALEYFELSKESLGLGYYYSIAELVSLYLSDTKYLLHFSSDSIISKETPSDWIEWAIEILESNSQVKVVNLGWDKTGIKMREEAISETDLYLNSFGFSDQMYLVRTKDFKGKIYNFHHPDSDRYPQYGGDLFEKRVDSWLRIHNFYRATLKEGCYIHSNFTNSKLKKKLSILLNKADLFS